MKKHLNTLYVTATGAYVHRERETIIVHIEQEKKLQLPAHTIGSIVCMGYGIMASPALMELCSEKGISLAFFTEQGEFIARVQGPQSGNVLLRRAQYRLADDEAACCEIARLIIAAKIGNSRSILQRCLRNYPEHENRQRLEEAIQSLQALQFSLRKVESLDEIRGLEGDAANGYFSCLNDLVTAQNETFFFRSRNRRPPLDPINALLSFVYTLLHHDVASALEGVGLDPAVGFLHRDRPGRMSLALDLMEEFRAYIADRLVISLINLGQVGPKGFMTTESTAVLMDKETRKEVLVAYQKRKQEEIRHLFLEESVTIGVLFHIQAQLLARYLRGDMPFYPAFLAK